VLTRFELRLHAERKNGLLSSDRIGNIWLEENGRLFGDAVEMIPACASTATPTPLPS